MNSRGNTLSELRRLDEALASYDRALKIRPDHAEALSNRGVTLSGLNRLDEALASYEHALEVKPDYAEALNNRGVALKDLKRLDAALASFDRALAVEPDYAEAHWNVSLCRLLMGDFVRGWEGYEWRWKRDTFTSPRRDFAQPVWLGKESLAAKTILLHSEQGLGDTLQFCRYARLVSESGARVIMEVPKLLLALLKNIEGVAQMVAKGSALPAFDYHCPLLSLPLAFNTIQETIPASIPYLLAEQERVARWRNRLGDHGLKVGINWQGGKNKADVGRSFPLAHFESIAKIPNVRLISLQKKEGTEQLKELPEGMTVEVLGEDFDAGPNAFLDSAAVIENLDLVITSDTAIAHLSGALGRETWVLSLSLFRDSPACLYRIG